MFCSYWSVLEHYNSMDTKHYSWVFMLLNMKLDLYWWIILLGFLEANVRATPPT